MNQKIESNLGTKDLNQITTNNNLSSIFSDYILFDSKNKKY